MKKILLLALALLGGTHVQSKSILTHGKDWYAQRKLNQEKKKLKIRINKWIGNETIRKTAYTIINNTLTLKKLKAANYKSNVLIDEAFSDAMAKASEKLFDYRFSNNSPES